MAPVAELYGRVPSTIRAAPLLFLIPAGVELAQHLVEIGLGMYRAGGTAAAGADPRRIAIGAGKVATILLVILFALRRWRFAGEAPRAARGRGRRSSGASRCCCS